MKKHLSLKTKKVYSSLIVILLVSNFISITFSFSYLSEESLNPIGNSREEFNPYKGTNCTKLGEYDSIYGTPYDMLITEHSEKTLAFIREQYGILIVDITDPEQPAFVHQLFMQDYFDSLYVSNDFLFLANSTDDLLIYNIRDIYNPILVFNGYFATQYRFNLLFVQNDVLYARDSSYGLVIFNISIPWDPTFISRYQHVQYYNRFTDIVVRDNYAFACIYNVLQIVDLTDIENPAMTGIFIADKSYANFRDIQISDDKAFICADDGRLFVLNISDVTNPTQIGQIWDNSKVFEDFYFDGSIGYLLSLREGLALLNLTNLQQIEYIDKEFNAGYYRSLGFHNGYPILLDRYEGLEIYKVKEDYSVEFVARFWDGGYGLDVKVSGNHAFVANAYNGLEIYQIRNSRTPELKSRINLGFHCREIFINKNLVYTISFDFEELYTIDISDKRKPKVLSVQNLLFELDNITYHPMYAAIFGDQAFVSYYSPIQGFLAFIDLTNTSAFQITSLLPLDSYISKISYASPYLYLMPNSRDCYIYYNNGTEWEVLTEFSIDDSVQDLFIYENFAYFATSYDLVIYNITNPLFPTETAIFHGSNYSYEGYDGVFVESDVAYLISEYEGDVHFVNILDKEYPYLEGIFKCNDSLTDLFVKDQVLYLTGAYVNLEIIQLDRFISLLNYIIYAPIAGIAVIIGIPILILVFARARRRRDTINNIPTTQMLPREEIQDPTQAPDNDSGIIVSPEDFDDSKLLVLAKKLVEAAEVDSK